MQVSRSGFACTPAFGRVVRVCDPVLMARLKSGPSGRDFPLRLDADVIAWLKKDGQGYQTRANQMLRERMLKELKG